MLPKGKPGRIFSDSLKEFRKASVDFGWTSDTDILQRSETNGVVDRAPRQVRRTAAWLVQSGTTKRMVGVRDALSMFLAEGRVLQFGSKVLCTPLECKDDSKFFHFGRELLDGIFQRYME